MKACKFYPEFEPNQVLTAEQLNQLTAYLEEHQRLTRSKLIGAGVVCGFEITKTAADGYAQIKISNGCGSTSEGYFMALCDENNADKDGETLILKYKRDYTDGAKVKYPYFLTEVDDEEEQINLWELLHEKEDDKCELFTDSFLSDKALILYLEISEQDYKSCTGSDCDEKGKGIEFCVKKLLIKKDDLNKIIIEANEYEQSTNLEETINARFQLNEVTIKRVGTILLTEVTTTEKLVEFYEELVGNTPDALAEQIVKIFEIYKPLFQKQYGIKTNSFDLTTLKTKLAFPQTTSGCTAQYHYDFLKDIILAYNEFRETAFELLTECCIDEKLFPRHLMIGDFAQAVCEPSIYRQRFITAPIYNSQDKLKDKFISQYKRLSFIVNNYSIPNSQTSQIRITPSKEKETILSERSIPFYYQVSDISEVKKKWNFELARKCKSNLLYSYYENTDSFLLSKNIDDYPFLRIEGLCGKEFKFAYNEVNALIKLYRLPIKAHGLVIGTEIDEAMEISHCYFSDLDADYTAALIGLEEWYDEILEFLYSIKFSAKESEEEEKETEGKYVDGFTGIKGTVKDAFGNPYPGMNITVTSGEKSTGAFTDGRGIFVIKNLKPGTYNLKASLIGTAFIEQEAAIIKDKTLVMEIIVKAGRQWFGEVAGKEGKYFYEMPEEMKKYTTRYAGMNVKYRKELYGEEKIEKERKDIKLKEYTIGWLYENYILVKSKVDTIDAITDFIKIIGEENLTIAAADFIQVAEKLLKLIASITKAKNALPSEMTAKNIEEYVKKDYAALVKVAESTLKFFEKYKSSDMDDEIKKLLAYLNEIIKGDKLISLEAVYAVLKERVEKILQQFLFHEYAKKHQIQHQVGTIKGGTFLIVYDATGYVVADFMLPYICCSDCPPITLICEAKKEPPQIYMDEYEFCEDDTAEYEIYVSPEGGEVFINGVKINPTGENKYYLKPSEIGKGTFEVTYVYDEQTAKVIVTVYEINAEFSTEVDIDEANGVAIVKCIPVLITAESYEWDFGDGTILNADNFTSSADAENEGSTLQTPVHKYPLSEDEHKYIIKLKVKNVICEDEHTEEITLPPLEELIFDIEPKEYCKYNTTAVPFIYSPDGVVTGKGVILEGGKYKFLASKDEVKPGIVEFMFTANDGRTAGPISVQVEDVVSTFDIDILSVSPSAAIAKVRFTAFNSSTYQYEWKIDGQVIPEGNNKFQLEYDLDISTQTTFTIELKVTNKWCSGSSSQPLTITTCSAEYDLNEDHTPDSWYYNVKAKYTADSYKWQIINHTTGKTETYTTSEVNGVIYRTDKDQQVEIKLTIKKGTCGDTYSQTFNIIQKCNAEYDLTDDSAPSSWHYHAVPKEEADSYKWEVTNYTEDTKETSTDYELRGVVYKTNEVQKIGIALIIKKGNCGSSYVQYYDVGIEIETAKIAIPKTKFCRNETTPAEITGTPAGGTASGDGVVEENGKYFFYPNSSEITTDKVEITYTAPDGSEAKTEVTVLPIAAFDAALLSNSDDSSIPPDVYKLKITNKTLQGQNYLWTINGDEYNKTANPKELTMKAGREDINLAIILFVKNGDCYDTARKTVTVPKTTTVTDTDVTAPGFGIVYDNTTGGFTTAAVNNYLIADSSTNNLVTDALRGSVKINLTSLENIAGTEMYEKTFTSADNVYNDTKAYYEKINKDLKNPVVRTNYIEGKRNKQVADSYSELFEKAFTEIKNYRGPITKEKRQFAYNVMLLQVSQLMQMVTELEKDITSRSPLITTFGNLTEYLGELKNSGVDINPGGQLQKILMNTLEANSDKPVIAGTIENVMSALG